MADNIPWELGVPMGLVLLVLWLLVRYYQRKAEEKATIEYIASKIEEFEKESNDPTE